MLALPSGLLIGLDQDAGMLRHAERRLHGLPAVLIHRVTLAPEAEMEGTTLSDVLERVFARIEVPR